MGHHHSLKIPYTSENFPSKYKIKSSENLKTSWSEILWAALTVGRPNVAYVFRHDRASLYEANFRLSLIRMALEQDDSRNLKRTDAFVALDPSEKGAVSYFLGMTFCKLFASRLLNTPWLLHLDVFRNELNPTLLGRSRPDFVAFEKSGKRYAFESKGRSYPPSAKDIEKAKEQAQRLVRVNKTLCSLQIGTFAYFKSGILHFHWCDPEPQGDLLELIPPEHKWRHYYEPTLALVSNAGASIVQDGSIPLQVFSEIHPEIRRLLSERHWEEAYQIANELRAQFEKNRFQLDGVRIEASESWQLPFEGRFEF